MSSQNFPGTALTIALAVALLQGCQGSRFGPQALEPPGAEDLIAFNNEIARLSAPSSSAPSLGPGLVNAPIPPDAGTIAASPAAVNAVATAYLVFYSHISDPHHELSTSLHAAPTLLVAGAVLLTIVAVLAVKAATGHGMPLRGGLPSGHAAVAFAGWTAITIIADPFAHAGLVSMLAFLMALLVAQSRVEAGIHSSLEVMAGALIGTGMTIIVFQLWG